MKRLGLFLLPLLLAAGLATAQTAPVLTAITAVHVDARQRQVPTPTAPTITLPKATDATISLTVRNSDNTRTSITGAAITLTVRKALTDATPTISRLGTITDAANGVATFSIAQSDTSDLATGDYLYSVEAVWVGGAREQLVKVSPLKLVPTVGLPSDTPTTPTPEAVVAYGLPTVNALAVNKYLKVTDDDPVTLAWASGGGGGGGLSSLTCTAPVSCGADLSDVTISHAASGITAGSYGSASSVPVCSYNASGHATTCTSTAISIAASAVASGNLACARLPALTGDVSTSAGSCSVTVGGLQGQTVSNATPSSNQALLFSGGAWGPGTIGQSNVSGGYCALSGTQTIAGTKTFSSTPIADGLTAPSGGTGYLNFTDAGTATGDYETNQTGVRFTMANEITTATNLTGWYAKLNFPSNPVKRWASILATTSSVYIEMSPNGDYSGAWWAQYRSGAPQVSLAGSWKLLPEWDGTDAVHHYGILLGGAAAAGEYDGDKRWRAVGALLHEGPTAALGTSGAVTWQPVTSGEQGVIVSSGNVSSITLQLPSDSITPRTIDAIHLRLILKQGNASHAWPSSIVNAVLPAGVAVKPSLGLNEIDVVDCTLYAGDSKYLCDVRALGATPTWALYDSDLAALAANSSSGLWARTGSGTGAARTITGTSGQIGVTNGNGVSGNPTLSLVDTAVTPGTYGDSTHSARITVDQQGRITSVTSSAISGGGGGGGTTTNPLTIGTGLDGTSFDGSAPVTISLSAGAALANLASASVTNAKLANPATTVNGQTCTLGSTCTVTASTTAAHTAGTGLSGSSFDGSTARTWTVDQTFSPSWSGTHDYGSGVLKLPAGTTPAQTADASIFWDSDDDLLTVGTGAARKTMCDLDSAQTLGSKTFTTPTIASFTNATHNHSNAAGGGTLAASAIASGTLGTTYGGTGQDFSACTGVPTLSSGTASCSSLVPVARGGTNASAVGSAGSIPYSSGGTSYGFSNAYTSGYVWTSGGTGAPVAVQSVPVANGGTGLTGCTAGDLNYCSATNTVSALAVGSAGRALAVNQAGTAPAWGHIIDVALACTSSTTGGAAVNCDIITLPSGLGGNNTKSFSGTISVRISTNGSGGGSVALTCGTSHGGTDVLQSQTITAGTTGGGTWYGDKGDGSELGTKADSTRSYNIYVDGGSTISCTLGAPSGTVSAAVVVQLLVAGKTL